MEQKRISKKLSPIFEFLFDLGGVKHNWGGGGGVWTLREKAGSIKEERVKHHIHGKGAPLLFLICEWAHWPFIDLGRWPRENANPSSAHPLPKFDNSKDGSEGTKRIGMWVPRTLSLSADSLHIFWPSIHAKKIKFSHPTFTPSPLLFPNFP